MKRGLSVLIVALALGLAAAFAVCKFAHQTAPEDWLRKKFELNPEQARQAAALHREYRISCAEMCARIEQADARLRQAIRSSQGMTPEIQAAIAETDGVRTECRTNMLEYFYRVAAILPPTQKQNYLDMVLPTVFDPREMSGTHHQ